MKSVWGEAIACPSSCCSDKGDEVSPKASESHCKEVLAVPSPLPPYHTGTQPEEPRVKLVRAQHLAVLQELLSTRLTYL